MTRGAVVPISFVVEGDVDDAVVRRMALSIEVPVHEVFVRNGKPAVLRGLPGFNASAQSRPWFVQIDLDHDAPCPGAYVKKLLPRPSRHMQFRVAVRAVESWLMADRHGLSTFFRTRTSDIPHNPDLELDPKGAIITLAARSRTRIVRDGVPPRSGSGRRTGELYSALLIEFSRDHWNVNAARRNSASLDRAVMRLEELAECR